VTEKLTFAKNEKSNKFQGLTYWQRTASTIKLKISVDSAEDCLSYALLTAS